MRKLLVLFVLLFTLMGNSLAQLNWTKHGSAVLLSGSAGEWDDDGVGIPCVIFDGNTYKMWYSGSDGSHFRIGYATSPDGINWTKYNDPATVNPPYAESDPVLNLGPGAWENVWVYGPFVHFDGTTYRMWYAGTDGVHDRVGYATSLDGIIWTKNPANPVINLGPSGSWDNTSVDPGPIIFDGTTFHMLYNGSDGPHYQGGYATSPDGINWTKSADPVITFGSVGSWDNPRVQPNSVVYNSYTSKYYLFYSGGVMLDWRIGYATSSDFRGPWTKSPSILLDVTPGSFDSDVIAFPCAIYDSISEEYKMWYSGGSSGSVGAIRYATADVISQDTINIPTDYATIQEGINAAVNGDIVLVDEGTYYENITFKGKAITVASHFLIDGVESHISQTIIDGSQHTNPDRGSVVYFITGEDTNSVLCGFTITGGTGTYTASYDDVSGGGIFISLSSAKICNNIIENNSANYTYAYGGGILADSDLGIIIENNIIRNNSTNANTSTAGGGISLFSFGYARIVNNIITDNTITSSLALGGGIYCQGPSADVVIIGNYIKGNNCNSNTRGGGGFALRNCAAIVKNNLIVENSASNGGGVFLDLVTSTSTKSVLNIGRISNQNGGNNPSNIQLNSLFENNTIVNNSAIASGGGIKINGLSTQFTNFIIWGNTAPSGPQISGSADVQYSDIQGGYSGDGNIDLDPLFRDTLNNDYRLMSTDCGNSFNSPGIDAGNPSGTDWLLDCDWGLGQIRADMGAYGGDPYASVQFELLGPQFRAFVNGVNSVPSNEKQTVIDSFMNAASSFPFIEENTIAYFIYQGAVSSVNIPGDANNWETSAFPMTNLYGTNFWYYEAVYETDARLDYKFMLNGSDWILDPLNPNQVSGGYGPNSELAMPDYVQPPEIEYYPNISHGTIESFSFTSSTLGNSRVIKVYKPEVYDLRPYKNYPLLLLHDGLDYLNIGSVQNILDYLIANEKIEPIICVFVPPVDRDDEYGFNKTQQFESFILEELMPHIDSTYRTSTEPDKRAIGGLSLGGLITTQICYNHPESFGLAAAFSPAYWAKNMEVFNLVLNGPQKDIKWYLDWGTYEFTIMVNAVAMKDGLLSKSYDFVWNEWHEAHSWGSWRAHLDNALEFFFQLPNSIAEDVNILTEFGLSQNYPNPFNPSTIISWQSPVGSHQTIKVFDVLGNEIATLIDEYKPAGSYEVEFQSIVGSKQLASGIYFYQLRAGDFIITKKMNLIK